MLHLTTEFPPVIYGGLGTAVGGWVKASARSGQDVGVLLVEGALVLDEATYWGGQKVAPHAGPSSVVDRDRVEFFQSTWADAIETGVQLVGHWRPDVVHLHTAMLWPVAREIQRRTRRPLVYHVHSVDRAEYEIGEEPNQWLAHSVAQEEALAAADRLIALTDSEAELLRDYYPRRSSTHPHRRQRHRRHTARPPRFSPTTRSTLLVLYSGRLVERKGIRELLDAIPLVLAEAPDTWFVLAGGPPGLNGDEVAQQWLPPGIEHLLDRIHFTGWLTPTQLNGWYEAADILVCPSRYEPFGMVLLEGMLHGLAIVATVTGGSVEILESEHTALIVPPRDVEAIAAALLRLTHELGLRAKLGQAAAEDVRARWLWPERVKAMTTVYRELMRT